RLGPDRLHFHEAVIEHRRAAEVGQALAGQLVGVLAVGRELLPPDRQADNQPLAGAIGHAGARLHAAAIVERAHHIAVHDAARGGVGRMDIQMRFAFGGAQAVDIDERAVQEVARGRGNHRQRVACRQFRRGCRRFVRRHIGGHGIEAIARHRCRIEFALARRRREAALGKRRRADIEFLPAARLQRIPTDALGTAVIAKNGLVGDGFVAIGKARIGEAHARSQAAKDLGVRQR
uniref:Uncharacterized protein n=1 Tax=Solanum lycopersicum TaxID=4081 RepID=A0A494G982_SOLLC